MSHVVTETVLIKSLPDLKSAAAALGLVFVEGQTSFKWYGRFVGDTVPDSDPATWGMCDHAIRLSSNRGYEIGVVKVEGGYRLRYDAWCGGYGLEDVAGVKLSRLKSEYSAQVATKQLRREGYSVARKIVNGKLRLVAVKG